MPPWKCMEFVGSAAVLVDRGGGGDVITLGSDG